MFVVVLTAGCGGGGGGTPVGAANGGIATPIPSPVDPTPAPVTTGVIQVTQTLAQKDVPITVVNERFSGYNSAGSIVFGPVTLPKRTSYEFVVPITTVSFKIEYLDANGSVLYVGNNPVALGGGQTVVLNSPQFSVAPTPTPTPTPTPAGSPTPTPTPTPSPTPTPTPPPVPTPTPTPGVQGISGTVSDFCVPNVRGLGDLGASTSAVGDNKNNLWYAQPGANRLLKVTVAAGAGGGLTFTPAIIECQGTPTGICFADTAIGTVPGQILRGVDPGQNPQPPPNPPQIFVTCPADHTVKGFSLDGTLQFILGDNGNNLPAAVGPPDGGAVTPAQQAPVFRGNLAAGTQLQDIRAMTFPGTENDVNGKKLVLVATEKNSTNLVVITDDQVFKQFNVGQWQMPSPVVQEIPVPGLTPATKGTHGLAVSGKYMFFSETGANLIGSLLFQEGTYTLPLASYNSYTFPTVVAPTEMATDTKGNVWFIEPTINEVGYINVNGNTGVFPVPPPTGLAVAPPTVGLAGIGLGSDGNMWFTEATTNYIGIVGTNTANGAATFVFVAIQQDQMQPQAVAPTFVTLPNNKSYLPFATTSLNGATLGLIQTDTTLGAAAVYLLTVTPGFNGTTTGAFASGQGNSGGPLSPSGIAWGPDGNVWVANFFSNEIDKLTPPTVVNGVPTSGTLLARYGIPNNAALPTAPAGNVNALDTRPFAICVGPDGNLWFTEQNASKIGRLTTAGVMSDFAVTGGVRLSGITAGPNNDLYFVDNGANKIGHVTNLAANPPTITMTAIPTAGSSAQYICLGPDGNIWFTETAGANNGANPQIGLLTVATGVITEFGGSPLPLTPNGQPLGICAGPDGAVWFTESNGNKIGRIRTSLVATAGSPVGTTDEITIPTSQSGASGIIAGVDGNIWFTELLVDKVGAFNPTNQKFLELPLQTTGPGNYGMAKIPVNASFPKGGILFTETNVDKIGVIQH